MQASRALLRFPVIDGRKTLLLHGTAPLQSRWQSSNPLPRTQSTPPASAQPAYTPRTKQTAEEELEPRPRVPYTQFGRPFAKVFLGAMLTYQVIYWCWEKLRLDELKGKKIAELKELEAQVEGYKQNRATSIVTQSAAAVFTEAPANPEPRPRPGSWWGF